MSPLAVGMHSTPVMPAAQRAFLADVLAGLRRQRKRLPCKYFYDSKGSELFDRICQLPEYYLTRTEQAILRRHADDIARMVAPDSVLIEYGSGSSLKTRILLDHLIDPAAYVPIDISRTHLLSAARQLAAAYPQLRIAPLCADYTQPLALPRIAHQSRRRVVFFPGSTIGNFEPPAARLFLRQIRAVCGAGGAAIIGVDMKKDPQILHAAYNDAAGVTAQFNLNLLARLNRELDADIVLDRFAHYAPYNVRLGRVEMHLVSLVPQRVSIASHAIDFRCGESVFTESSYKYTTDEFATLAAEAGLRVQRAWLDDRGFFAVIWLSAA